MANWIFVDLGQFVDKIASILEKLSIYFTSVDQFQFIIRAKTSGPQIVFFDGNQGTDYLKVQMGHLGPKDMAFLAIDFSGLSPEEQSEIDDFLCSSKKIKGIVEKNRGNGLITSQLSCIKEISDLAFEEELSQEYFGDLKKKLNLITKEMNLQLTRAKELHRAIVPQNSWKQALFKRLVSMLQAIPVIASF